MVVTRTRSMGCRLQYEKCSPPSFKTDWVLFRVPIVARNSTSGLAGESLCRHDIGIPSYG